MKRSIILVIASIIYVGINYFFYRLLSPKEEREYTYGESRLEKLEKDCEHLDMLLNRSKYANWTLLVIHFILYIVSFSTLCFSEYCLIWNEADAEYVQVGIHVIFYTNFAFYFLLYEARNKQIENKQNLMREIYSLYNKIEKLENKDKDNKKSLP